MRLVVAALSTLVVALSGQACSSSDSGGTPRQCLQAPAPVDLTQPMVSFKSTILPIVQARCALPACHADPNTSLGIYLPPDDGAQVLRAFKSPAPTSLKLDFVKPSAPEESFLMHKLDGTQCGLDKDCVNDNCGNLMPSDGQLSLDDRNAFRRWIAQGAQDN